ncbi:hypothetical protein MMC19_007787 [Ptychographa xylographoides]|nr:hypothetical protein [Ptychographa xylographoides]
MPHNTPADGDAEMALMIAVTQALSGYLRYVPVPAAELPGLVRDVARRVAPQVLPSADQTPAPPKKPRRRRMGSTAEDQEPVAATKLVVHNHATSAHKAPVADDAIDLAKVQITKLPARRARGL